MPRKGVSSEYRCCPQFLIIHVSFAMQQIEITVAALVQQFEFELVGTVWERDVAATRESLLTAPSFESKGIKFRMMGRRERY